MKINTFTAILSIAFAGLITFFFSFYISDENKWIVSIGSFLTLAVSMFGTVSLSFDYDRTTMLTRTTSGVFLAFFLATQIFFVFINAFSLPIYVLVTGGMTLLYVLVVYGISQSKH